MISSVGFADLLWFWGQVEEVAGGTGLAGRVRVRAMGIHPPLHWTPEPDGFAGDEQPDVPTEALPWAPVLSGGGAAKMPGVGEWVVGFFVDGRDAQHPVIVGVLPGFNTTLPFGSGTQYDSQDTAQLQANIDNFGESSPTAPEAWTGSGNAAETSAVQNIRKAAFKTSDGRDVEELPPEFGGDPDRLAVVQATAQGSSIQVGGSKSKEHISIIHESGTHIQIDSKGNVKIGSGQSMQHVAANIQQYADGTFDIIAGENLSINVAGGKATINVEGDIDLTSGGNITLNAARKIKLNAGESIMQRGAQIDLESNVGNVNVLSAQKLKMTSGAMTSIQSQILEVKADGTIQAAAGGELRMSGSNTKIYGGTVYVDDVVRMAEGGASAVASASEAAVTMSKDDMPQPKAVSVTSPTKTAPGMSGAVNSAQIDDDVQEA